jgi:hypothetical protein
MECHAETDLLRLSEGAPLDPEDVSGIALNVFHRLEGCLGKLEVVRVTRFHSIFNLIQYEVLIQVVMRDAIQLAVRSAHERAADYLIRHGVSSFWVLATLLWIIHTPMFPVKSVAIVVRASGTFWVGHGGTELHHPH